MKAAIVLLAALALVSTTYADPAANADVEKMSTYKVMGYVSDFNAKYVRLQAKKKYRIVPRHSIENSKDIRPGKLAIARLTVKDIASVSKFQKSKILPQ